MGQQFPAPPADTPKYDINFSKGANSDWLQFVTTYTVQSSDTWASLQQQFPDIATLNPYVNADTLAADMVLATAVTPTLTLTLTQELIEDSYPATTLTIPGLQGPNLLPLAKELPQQYTLQNNDDWQIGTPDPLCRL